MEHSDAQKIKESLDIVNVISEYVPNLTKKGQNHFGLCPFHKEKSPSFSVNENLQIFKCFGCGKGGDVISFIMEIENIDFKESMKFISKKYNINLGQKTSFVNKELEYIIDLNKKANTIFRSNLKREEISKNALTYLKERNINQKSIETFELGYATKIGNLISEISSTVKREELVKYGLLINKSNGTYYDKFRERIIFPIYDENKVLRGFSGRYIGKKNKSAKFTPPKYLNSPETPLFKKSNLLYSLDKSKIFIKKKGFVITTEGQMNVLASYQVNIKNIVANLGTAFTEYQCKLLKKFTNEVCIAYDKDTAGKKSLIRNTEILLKNGFIVTCAIWDKKFGKDPDELINYDKRLWYKSIRQRKSVIEVLISTLNKSSNITDTQYKSISTTITNLINSITDQDIKRKYQYLLKNNSLLSISKYAKSSNISTSRRFKSIDTLSDILSNDLAQSDKDLIKKLLIDDNRINPEMRALVEKFITHGINSVINDNSKQTNQIIKKFFMKDKVKTVKLPPYEIVRKIYYFKIQVRKELLLKESTQVNKSDIIKEISLLTNKLERITKELYKDVL